MPDKARKLHIIRIIRIFVKRNELRPMTIFDDYIRNKGCCKVSKTLLWDYDLQHSHILKQGDLVLL